MTSKQQPSPTRKSKKLSGLVKSVSAFRKSKGKKAKRTSSKAANTAMDDKNINITGDSKNMFLVEDSNSSTTEDVNLLELESADGEYGLDLVVLLMHPVSHRFELLQLEFGEANKAKISDLLAQVPLSVTEDCLKDQLYDSILDQNSADEGRPLVLKSTKLVDAFGRRLSKAGEKEQPSLKMVLVARPQGLSNEDALKMAKPIFTNKDISSMLALSGFDVKPWKKKKFVSGSAISLAQDFDNIEATEERVQNSTTSLVLLGLVFATIVSMLLHSVMIKTTPTEFVLKPGTYASKCGLLGFIPTKKTTDLFQCHDEFLSVNKDGTATLYDEDREAIMMLKGGICDGDDNTSCVDGLVMKADNTLLLGGKRIKQVLVKKSHKDKKLSWPFEEEPKVNYKIVSSLN